VDDPTPTKKITNWEAFTESLALDTDHPVLETADDIENAVRALTGRIQEAVSRNTVEIPLNRVNPYDLPRNILNIKRQRNRTRKRARETGDPRL